MNYFTNDKDFQESYNFLEGQLRNSKMSVIKTQLTLMTKIYEFFRKNEQFDYTVSDIRKEVGLHVYRYSIESALWRLQRLGYVKYQRDISNQPSYQLSSWKQC